MIESHQTSAQQTVVLGKNGDLLLPEDVQNQLGLMHGSRLALTVEADRIVLQPVSPQLVRNLAGLFAGGPSLVEDLLAWRRSEP